MDGSLGLKARKGNFMYTFINGLWCVFGCMQQIKISDRYQRRDIFTSTTNCETRLHDDGCDKNVDRCYSNLLRMCNVYVDHVNSINSACLCIQTKQSNPSPCKAS